MSTLERPTRKLQQQQYSRHQNIVSGTIAECGAHNISGTNISGGAVSGNDTIKVKLKVRGTRKQHLVATNFTSQGGLT